MALDTLAVAVAALAIGAGLSDTQADHVHRRLLEERDGIHAWASAGEMMARIRGYIAEVRPPVVPANPYHQHGWRCLGCTATGHDLDAAASHCDTTSHAITPA